MITSDYAQLWAELPTLLFLPLTQGKFAVIDGADYPLVCKHNWVAVRKGRRWYVNGHHGHGRRTRTTEYLHQIIARPPKGRMVDHKNGNSLDNRRSNVRVCTYRQNNLNRCGYKGKPVGVSIEGGKFLARLNNRRLGKFDSIEEAARAWDAKAREVNGEFAYQNFDGDDAKWK